MTKTTLTALAAAGVLATGGLSLAAAATTDPPPKLVELTYGKLKQPGVAGRQDAFRLKVTDPNGEITVIKIASKAGDLQAKRGCGEGGRTNGGTTTAYITAALPSGTQKVTVTLSSVHCNGKKAGALQHKTFVKYVKGP